MDIRRIVRDNEVTYEKIDIGPVDTNYERYSWDFGLAANTPEDIFTHEQHEGNPDGAIGCGCIRGATPKLYLIGRGDAAPATNAVLHRFTVGTGFVQQAPGTIPFDDSLTDTPVNINHVAGIEVIQGTAFFLVLNNRDTNEFRLFRYPIRGLVEGRILPIISSFQPITWRITLALGYGGLLGQ